MWNSTPARAAYILLQLALCKFQVAEANNDGKSANSDNLCVETDGSGSGFLLASPDSTTTIYTDPASPAAIHHVAASFAHDLQCVVKGANVNVKNVSSIDELGSSDGSNCIFFGALDSGNLISQVVNATNIDVSDTRGQWESWTIQQGQLAQAGGQTVTVMAGADRVSLLPFRSAQTYGSNLFLFRILSPLSQRGAAYAAYTVSEESGVSPWYW